MGDRKNLASLVDATQADGAQTITLDTYADFYTVSAVPADTDTTGTLAFEFKAIEEGAWENLIDVDTDAQISVDLADGESKSFIFNTYVKYIRVTPTSASDTYSVYIQQGEVG